MSLLEYFSSDREQATAKTKQASIRSYCQHGVKISRSPNPQPRLQTKHDLVIETPKRPVGRPKKARVGENPVETDMLSDISEVINVYQRYEEELWRIDMTSVLSGIIKIPLNDVSG